MIIRRCLAGLALLALIRGGAFAQGGWTDDGTSVRLTTASDNVGIGTSSPGKKLTVVQGNDVAIRVQSGSSSQYTSIKIGRNTDDGVWGVASSGTIYSNFSTAGDIILRSDVEDLILTARNSSGAIRFGTGSNDTQKMVLTSSGTVGIGTTVVDEAYKLDVNGKIKATDIKVQAAGSDFVFEDGYELMSLPELERFIREKRHLPSVPKATEFERDGVYIGRMQSILLQKIEELTLYVISVQQENERLENRVTAIEKSE